MKRELPFQFSEGAVPSVATSAALEGQHAVGGANRHRGHAATAVKAYGAWWSGGRHGRAVGLGKEVVSQCQ